MASSVPVGNGNDVGILFGSHYTEVPGFPQDVEEHLVGKIVKLLDFLALDIFFPGQAQDLHQSSFIDLPGDDFGGKSKLIKDPRQFTRRTGVFLLFLINVAGEVDADLLVCHGTPLLPRNTLPGTPLFGAFRQGFGKGLQL